MNPRLSVIMPKVFIRALRDRRAVDHLQTAYTVASLFQKRLD